ncbi:MAG: HAD-IA family hydrolase [Proteobacteria bacterium]|nr:HAD-IA family hydrolase [Pseudomonadota bacterium]
MTFSIAPPWAHIDCVILDMDGTLLDLNFDNQLWSVLLPQRVAEREGVALEQARHQVLHRLEARRGTLPWYCLEHWSEAFGVDMHGLERELGHLIRARPGALDFLAWVRARGLRQVLATNAHPASLERKLAATGIGAHFTDIVSAHELGAAKEDPAFWDALRARLAFDPARALFIDDNAQVRAAARRWGIAHLFGIAQPDSRGPQLSADDCLCLSDFGQLTRDAA